ncbi:unnamed protein product [Pseudo-nitzschia multistriata]|uniref:Uncharacterized protein n=1 Tax=Pseudo-nitzschia multistriata TaxID=183589 RepID=A0A448YWE6_9STRA|nr:unnamed protein product [Pseudo-nitzschia multistriata]
MKRQAQPDHQKGSENLESIDIIPTATSDDDMFSTALMKLSFTDRSAIEEELHGVSCMAVKETPELIEDALRCFDVELHKIDHKPGYDRAQEILMENSAVDTTFWLARKEFKLRFLRCEFFDPQKAAARFVSTNGCHIVTEADAEFTVLL